MCRLTAYFGPQIVLADLVTRPKRSVIRQSFDARERLGGSGNEVYEVGNLNADGFGIGWYSRDDRSDKLRSDEAEAGRDLPQFCNEDETNWSPCVFTDTGPAWNNRNLRNIAEKVSSSVIFAHVRAAGPGMGLCHCASHPFRFGRYLFMHNGQVGRFSSIRRSLLSKLNDVAFSLAIQNSCSDSALAFALFVNQLDGPFQQVSPSDLRQMLINVVEEICTECRIARLKELDRRNQDQSASPMFETDPYTSLLNFVVTDGSSLVATRYVHYFKSPDNSKEHATPKAASLYFASGSRFEPEINNSAVKDCTQNSERDCTQQYRMRCGGRTNQVVIVTSEPLTDTEGDWVPIPTNNIILIPPGKEVLMSPLLFTSETDENVDAPSSCISVPMKHAAEKFETVLENLDDAFKNKSSLSRRLSSHSLHMNEYSESVPVFHPLHKLQSEFNCLLSEMVTAAGHLFSSGPYGSISVWELMTFSKIAEERILVSGFTALHADESGKLLFAASLENDIHVLDILSPRNIRYLKRIKFETIGHILSIATTEPDTLFVGSKDTFIRRLSTQCESNIEYNAGTPHHVDVYSDWDSVNDTDLSILSCKYTREELSDQTNSKVNAPGKTGSHYAAVNTIVVTQNFICSGGDDGVVKIWEKEKGCLHRELFGHRKSVLSLAVDTFSNTLYSGSADGTVRVWDLDTFACRRSLACGQEVTCVETFPLSKIQNGYARSLLLTGMSNGKISVWHCGSFDLVATLALGSPDPVFCISIGYSQDGGSNDPSFVLCSNSKGVIMVWKAAVLAHFGSYNSRLSVDGYLPSVVAPCSTDTSNDSMIDTLSEFIAIPSVSSDPKFREDCWVAAKFLAAKLDAFGCRVKICTRQRSHASKHQSDSLPLILAKMEANLVGNSNRPAPIVIYGHYDVVSASIEDWSASSSPWRLESLDGFFYGRGISDDKGPIIAAIFAAKKLQESGDLKRDIIFLFEGEEESGVGIEERGLCQVVRQNLGWFTSQGISDTGKKLDGRNTISPCAILISNNTWIDENRPCLNYGMRGVIDFEIVVRGPAMNLHAGVDGGPIHEPFEDLNAILFALSSEKEKVFAGGVQALTDPEKERYASVNLKTEEYGEAVGVEKLRYASSLDILCSRWSKPSISICSISSSNTSRARRRIPASCKARVSLHFVPNQDADEQKEKIVSFINDKFQMRNSGNRLEVRVNQVSNWWYADPNTPIFDLAFKSIERVWGIKPLFVREGGSYGGITPFLEKTLGAPALHIPLAQASDNAHLQNERIRIKNLLKGREVLEDLLMNL